MTSRKTSRPRDAVDQALGQWAEQRPDLDTSGMDVVLRVLVLAGRFSERLKAILAPAGIAPFEFDVLSALRRAGRDGSTPKELCEAGQLTSGAMTHRLDRLEERGLVRRRAAKDDRRSVVVLLTPRGRRLVDGLLGARMEDAGDCVASLSRAERRTLARLLRRVAGEVESRPSAGR